MKDILHKAEPDALTLLNEDGAIAGKKEARTKRRGPSRDKTSKKSGLSKQGAISNSDGSKLGYIKECVMQSPWDSQVTLVKIDGTTETFEKLLEPDSLTKVANRDVTDSITNQEDHVGHTQNSRGDKITRNAQDKKMESQRINSLPETSPNKKKINLEKPKKRLSVVETSLKSNINRNSTYIPCRFEELPTRIHKILATQYITSVFDLKHIGQAFKNLKLVYTTWSWRYISVVCDETPQTLRRSNKRTIPFRVFVNPEKYSSWYMYMVVKSIEFQLPLSKYEGLDIFLDNILLDFSKIYPKLKFCSFVYNETDYWQIDDLKYLMEELDGKCDIGIVANISAKNCVLLQANVLLNMPDKLSLKYLAIDMSSKPSWIGLGDRSNLDFVRFRLCDFANIETLLLQTHTGITIESHKAIMIEISQLKKLKVFGTCLVSAPVTIPCMLDNGTHNAIEAKKTANYYYDKYEQADDNLVLQYPETKTQSTHLLQLLSNFNYITKQLNCFMVSVSSTGPFDAREYTNRCLQLSYVTHFSCKVQDTSESPILDHLRFNSEKLFSLKLAQCATVQPTIPNTITELIITTTGKSSNLVGYAKILKLDYPNLRTIKLVAEAPLNNLWQPEEVGTAQYPNHMLKEFAKLMYEVSRHKDLFQLIVQGKRQNDYVSALLLNIFPVLKHSVFDGFQDDIISLIVNPEEVLHENNDKLLTNRTFQRQNPGSCIESNMQFIVNSMALIECFVNCCRCAKSLKYIYVDGYALFSMSPRFHAYFIRSEYPTRMYSQVDQIRFTGTDIARASTTIKEKYLELKSRYAKSDVFTDSGNRLSRDDNGAADDISILLDGYPFDYIPVCEVSKNGKSNIIIDLAASRNLYVRASVIKGVNPHVFDGCKNLYSFKEHKGLKFKDKVSDMLEELNFDKAEHNGAMNGWLK